MVTDVEKKLPCDLTIATVCWNAIKCVHRCIESVQPLYKSELKVEHLFVDGVSTDGTLEYLQDQLAEGRISRVISEPDNGLYDAMNKAIKHARGKIIVFINSDDEIFADAVPACCEPILSGRVSYTVASSLYISDTGEKLLVPHMKRALWRQPYCHQSMFCSTELLRKVGGFRGDKFRIGADTELMRRLYIDKIPYEVLSVTASRFYDGGVSSSPAVIAERYELMMHFENSYRDEVASCSAQVNHIVKHIRRYAVQKILADNDKTLMNREYERLKQFMQTITERLPYSRRVILFVYLFASFLEYKLMSCMVGRKGKDKDSIRAQISLVFLRTFFY